mmetsp:Transcript_61398/g.176761  ORF Transcript_61398/g.176761 Transcript_61398/m.176761 type:complete len:244 (+) Transcript_61398:3-734(+)
MAGRWCVLIQGLHCLPDPERRLGDRIRRARHTLCRDEAVIKNVIVEVGFGDDLQSTRPFGVSAGGHARLGETLYVKAPPPGAALDVRVVKVRRARKDTLIGEAKATCTIGKEMLPLDRDGLPAGYMIIDVSDGQPRSEAQALGRPRSGAWPMGADGWQIEPRSPPRGVPPCCLACVGGVLDLLGLGCKNAGPAKESWDPNCKVRPSGPIGHAHQRDGGALCRTPTSIYDGSYEGRFIPGSVFD